MYDLENVVNESGYQAKKIKDDRGPQVKFFQWTGKSLIFPGRKQFFRHRKKTLAALAPIHAFSGATKKLPQKEDPGCTCAHPYFLWSHKKVTIKQQTNAWWFVDNININRIKAWDGQLHSELKYLYARDNFSYCNGQNIIFWTKQGKSGEKLACTVWRRPHQQKKVHKH